MANFFILDRKSVTRGVLSNTIPDGCPYHKDKYKIDIRTGWTTLEFEVPADRMEAEFLEMEGRVVFPDFKGQLKMVRIKDIDDTAGNGLSKYIYAEGIQEELLDDRVRPITLENATSLQSLESVILNSGWLPGIIEGEETAAIKIEDYPTILEAVQMIADTFGLYPVFRVEYQPLTNRYIKIIDLLEQVGQARGKMFDYRDDLIEVTRKQSSKELYTAVLPLGKARDYGDFQREGIKDVVWSIANGDPADKPLGQDIIIDWEAARKWSPVDATDDEIRIKVGKYENSEQGNDDELILEGWEWLQQNNTPSFEYSAKAIDLNRLAGLEHEQFDAGDIVIVRNLDFNPPMLVEAEIMLSTRSHSDPSQDEFEFGNYKDIYQSQQDLIDRLIDKINRKEGEWSAAGQTWFEGAEPPDPAEYTTWLKNDTIPHVWMKWSGTTWNRATSTQPGDVGTIGESEINIRDDQAEANAINFTIDRTPKVYSQPERPTGNIPEGSHWLDETKKIWYKYRAGQWEINSITDLSELDGIVVRDQIGIGAVAEQQLADLAVTMEKIKDGAITREKIDVGAVGPNEIEAGAITEEKMKWSTHLLF